LNFYDTDQWGDSVSAKLFYLTKDSGGNSDHWPSISTESITNPSLITLHGGVYTNADYTRLIIEWRSTSRYCILLMEI